MKQTTVHLLKKDIDAIFAICEFCKAPDWRLKYGEAEWQRLGWGPKTCTCKYKHQADALVAVYRLLYPGWDDIASVDGFPQCHEVTWEYIAHLFMAFDRCHHPDVMNGGLWLNNGWGTQQEGKDLREFEVMPAPVTLKETVPALKLMAA